MVLGLMFAIGCTGQDDTGPAERPLIAPEAWEVVPDGDGPFGYPRPDPADVCEGVAIDVEPDGVEIETTDCNWALLSQPALVEGTVGETLTLLAWHQALLADQPATGVMAFAVHDRVLWTQEVGIPAVAAVYDPAVALTTPIAAGDVVWFHVHNHGNNTWKMASAILTP